ncbi:hypothetical protein V1515DRAFT_605581 [Lipomyces mesembrius]
MQGSIIFTSILAMQLNLRFPSTEYDGSKFKRIDLLGSFTLVTGLRLFLIGVSVGLSAMELAIFPYLLTVCDIELTGSGIVNSPNHRN